MERLKLNKHFSLKDHEIRLNSQSKIAKSKTIQLQKVTPYEQQFCSGRLAALTRLDLIGSCKCSVAVVAANQRSLFHCFSGRVSLTRDGELGRRRGWMRKTRSSPVVPAKKKILKSKQFSLGTATAIFLSQTNMSTFKDARTFLLKSYLDVVIDDDEFILLCDESFLKKPKSPDEFFLFLLAIMTSKYKNTETTH